MEIKYCGGADGNPTDCRKWTKEGEVHFYLAPILNALYDDASSDNLTCKKIRYLNSDL